MFGLNDALEIVPGDLGAETCQILDNTVQLSQRSREPLKNVFTVRICLPNPKGFDEINQAHKKYF